MRRAAGTALQRAARSAPLRPAARPDLLLAPAAAATQRCSLCTSYKSPYPDKAEHTGGLGNIHRSNAEELIAMQPVIEVDGHVACCDGGGGSLGHPLEYMQLDKVNREAPATCKYCGLRFVMSHH